MTNFFSWWRSQGDRRTSTRHHLQQATSIAFDNGTTQRGCVISDISETGARIMVPNGPDLPEEFTVLIPRRCRIARRMYGEVGVKFIDYHCS
jgi:hypothetical protein